MDINTFLHFDISAYAMLYLGMLFVLIIIRKEIYSVSTKLMLYIIATNILILLFEILSWVFDGLAGDTNYYILYIVNTLGFVFVGFIFSYWLSYIDYVIYKSKDRLKKKVYYLWVALVTSLFALVNLFIPLLFRINEDNIYERGFFFNVYFVLFVLLFVYYFVMTAYKKGLNETRNVLMTIYLFLAIVVIAGIIQAMFYGVLLLWPVMALSTSIIYIFLETTTHNRDYLTKLYSRYKADQYMAHLKEDKKHFAVVMIDIDDYKEVNDIYGHMVGDEVLRIFARVLEREFKDDGMVSRFGGDEFLIVLEDVDEQYLKAKKEMVHYSLRKELVKFPFEEIMFSYGYSFENNEKTIDEIVVEADNNMYKNKAENKNHKRRKTD
jgi:diguanylate cyclase (GGDEF)-like protein